MITFEKAITWSLDLLKQAKQSDQLDQHLHEFGLELTNNSVKPAPENKQVYADAEAYWDKRQLVRKINLNSAYGGLLNQHMKFFDQRIGQSTTLTGRCITKHMASKTNEMLCGVYDHYGKCLIYGDTDSVFFSAWPELKTDIESGAVVWDKNTAVELYDQISDAVSDTFPDFLHRTFNIPLSRGEIIKSGREVVGETGLFVKKKRYAILYYDKEGTRYDKDGAAGKMKTTGLDLKRSDTPKYMQKFMADVLKGVLEGSGEAEVVEKLKEFKKTVREMKPWLRAAPKSVNNLTSYQEKQENYLGSFLQNNRHKKVALPGHVRASLNWNSIRERKHDLTSMKITDGMKVIVCPLKPNDYQITSIAYPVDETRLPSWFLELPFDEDQMMTAIVDKKMTNLLGVLRWDFSAADEKLETFNSLFEF